MKRIFTILLALLLVLSSAACAAKPHSTPVAPDSLPELVLLPDDAESAKPDADEPPVPDATSPDAQNAGDEPVSVQSLPEDGSYTSKDDVALYLHLYGRLPGNFITKKEAEALGWNGGSLEPYAPGKCIGGSRFGNYEGLLPAAEGRRYTECDIDTLGAKSRGAKRIVFSNDGLVYYTDDHYASFTLLYGEETKP